MRSIVLLFCLIGWVSAAFAQDPDDYAAKYFQPPGSTQDVLVHPTDLIYNPFALSDSFNVFRANFGFVQIGDQRYVGFRLTPEFAFGKIGLGFDLPLLFNLDNGSFRTEEYARGIGLLRLVSYFRYGVKKKDPVHVRVGSQFASYLGYGILMNNYTNSASFERRKVGVSYDILFKEVVGIEGIYSDFTPVSLNLLGFRPYVRPLHDLPVPVIRTLEFGTTFITDRDQTTQLTRTPDGEVARVKNEFLDRGMTAWGLDMGMTFLRSGFLTVTGSIQWAKLFKNRSDSLATVFDDLVTSGAAAGTPLEDGFRGGRGFSIGAQARMNFIANIFTLDARLERLWYTDHFIPQFFDALYEINKDARIRALGTASGMQGTYGMLTANLINKIRVRGSLLLPDEVTARTPAVLQLYGEAYDFHHFILAGSYTKGGITGLSDVFVLDDRSLAQLRLAYRIGVIFAVGVDYYWTFLRKDDGRFKLSHYVMPYFGLHLPLNARQREERRVMPGMPN